MENMKSNPHKDQTSDRVLAALSSSLELGGRHSVGGGLTNIISPHLSTIDESGNTLDAVSDLDLTDGDDLEASSLPSGASYHRQSSPSKRVSKDQQRSTMKRSSAEIYMDKENEDIKCKQQRSDQNDEIYMDKENEDIKCKQQRSDQNDDTGMNSVTPGMKRQAPHTPQVVVSQYTTPTQGSPLIQGSPLMQSQLSGSRIQKRAHSFCTKTVYFKEVCQPCGKTIKFGKDALKCRDCRAVCHRNCRDSVPLPCVPTVATPGKKVCFGSIADFTPCIAPMIPALVVHCTNEIERRGCNEIGIYRVSAVERDVKELKEKFLRGKGTPNLANLDIHVISSTVKHFLRGLKEPLITHSLWPDFISASQKPHEADCEAGLYQAVSGLPQPNRDTLAWMIIHLQRVAEVKECLMPLSNLGKVFGPTLVGYSVGDPTPEQMLRETADQQLVMSKLLSISRDYWEKFTVADNLFPPRGEFASPLGRTSMQHSNNRRRSIIGRVPLK